MESNENTETEGAISNPIEIGLTLHAELKQFANLLAMSAESSSMPGIEIIGFVDNYDQIKGRNS